MFKIFKQIYYFLYAKKLLCFDNFSESSKFFCGGSEQFQIFETIAEFLTVNSARKGQPFLQEFRLLLFIYKEKAKILRIMV